MVHNPKKGLFKLIQTKALKMGVFTNGGVFVGLKICHFQGFTVAGFIFVWLAKNLGIWAIYLVDGYF